MDIWEELYSRAKEEYHPHKVSPFVDAHEQWANSNKKINCF